MGASLYERYLAEQEPKPQSGSLYGQYLRSKEKPIPRESLKLDIAMPSESTRALPHNRPNRAEDTSFAGVPEGTGSAALGMLASGAQAIPGMEAVQAGARSLVRGQPFGEARDDIRAVTDEIPLPIKLAAQAPAMVGGAVGLGKLAAKVPGMAGTVLRHPAGAGAVIGAADQGLSADDMTLDQRLGRASVGAGVGAGLGALLDDVVTIGRAARAPKVDANKLQREKAMLAADKKNYGAARREAAAAGGTSPELQAALDQPVVREYVAAVRALPKHQGKSDAEVLRVVYKRMNDDLGGKLKALKREYNSNVEDEVDALRDAKNLLLDAADPIMPGFRKAVGAHAAREREMRAVTHGSEAARRLIGKTAASANPHLSPAALREKAPSMTLEELVAADQGALGKLREGIGIQPNAVSVGGLLTTAIRPLRVSPLLRDIGTPKQRLLDDIIRAGLLGTAAGVP